MNNPVVSVIVPNYNHARYLEKRIDSILQQTYQSFELILLDDCSTDNSRKVLSHYRANEHVSHLILNEKNSGSPFEQWNKGFALARGRYIWIAESDDFADPDFLMQTVTVLDNNPDVSVVYTGSQMVDENGAPISLDWDRFKRDVPLLDKYSSSLFLLRKMLWKTSIYNASMALFRKECFENVDKEYLSFKYCGDWFFWTEICKQGNVASINRKLNYFRQHTNKVSPKAEKDGLYFIEGARVTERLMTQFDLTSYQRKVLAGRALKRLYKATKGDLNLRQSILDQKRYYSSGTYYSIILYVFDKWFNISGLHR